MNFTYDKSTDSLYIEFSAKKSAESEEVAPGIVADYDEAGRIVGLDIEDASSNISLTDVHFRGFMPKIDAQQGV